MKVGVVLLNWNAGDLTIPCVESLLAGRAKPWRIVVFDNASTDGSAERIAREFPGVVLQRSATNLGFTGGNNAAIAGLLRDGAEAVWILNNDTRVADTCLAELIRALQEHPEAGAATGKILYREPAGRLWYAGGDLQPVSFGGRHRGLGKADRGQFDAAGPVTFVSGCCMLVRAPVLQALGLFHSRYFAYDEDVEWCWRARARGIVLWYAPRAVLLHDVSASMRRNSAPGVGRISAEAHYLEARNRLFTVRLHARGAARWMAALAYGGRAAWLLGGLTARLRGAKLRARMRGIRDGVRTPLSAGVEGAAET